MLAHLSLQEFFEFLPFLDDRVEFLGDNFVISLFKVGDLLVNIRYGMISLGFDLSDFGIDACRLFALGVRDFIFNSFQGFCAGFFIYVRNDILSEVPSTCLGGSNGAGFGWQDIDVFKLGVQVEINDRWTVRAGYNHTDNPIQAQDVTFNILAPGVIKDHVTLGATWKWDARNEITGSFMYAFENSVEGPSLFNSFFPPGAANMQEKIEMYEWSLGVQWSRRF